MPTSKDVARLANVSQSTVSYVMSGKRPISPETRRRVEAAIELLTYQPNAGARALASQRTQVIGLVVPFGPSADVHGLLPFIEVITAGAREHDHDVLLVTADEGPAALTRLEGRRLCDAIVLMEIEAKDERIPLAASLRVPVVLIGVPQQPMGLPCVDLDFEQAARLAIEDAADLGHDRVLVLGYSAQTVRRDINYVRRFHEEAARVAERRGLSLTTLEPVEPDLASVRQALTAHLDLLRPTADGRTAAVLVPASAAVQPALNALTELGLVPGRQVSVTVLSTDAVALAAHPAVSNVSLEPKDVSRLAVRTIFTLLGPEGSAPPPGLQLVQPRLSRRRTSLVPG